MNQTIQMLKERQEFLLKEGEDAQAKVQQIVGALSEVNGMIAYFESLIPPVPIESEESTHECSELNSSE